MIIHMYIKTHKALGALLITVTVTTKHCSTPDCKSHATNKVTVENHNLFTVFEQDMQRRER